jgi:hypothetical protein
MMTDLSVMMVSGWLSHSLLQYQNREEVSIAVCEELCKMYSLQQRIAIVEAYVCTGSIKETRDILQASSVALAYQQRVV